MKQRYPTVLMLLLFYTSSLFAQSDKSVSYNPEQAFDFWVGNWEVSWKAPDSSWVHGTNTVVKILDDKVIQENFFDPSRNFKGTSISVFNPKTEQWNQAWADNNGSFYNFVGELLEEQRIFKMQQPDKRGATYRMVFSEITEHSFIWEWQGIREGLDDWKTVWRIRYTRKD